MKWFVLFGALLFSTTAIAQSVFEKTILPNWSAQMKYEQSIDKAFEAAAKSTSSKAASPVNTQAALDAISHDLDKLSDEHLYFLKASSDVCTTPQYLNCRGLSSATVRPFVEMTLDKRRATLTRIDFSRTFYLSSGSLVVSVVSLLISGLATFMGWRRR